MRLYRATVWGDRYPLEFSVEASSWSTAANRLVRMYTKRFKRSRAETITIRITRSDIQKARVNELSEPDRIITLE